MSTSKDSSKGKSPSTSSKSSKSSKSAKDQVEEPIFVQDSDYVKHDVAEFDNTNMLMDQGEDLGKTDEQPNDEDVPKYDWYKKSRSDTSLDPEWNEGKLVDDGLAQRLVYNLLKGTCKSYVELDYSMEECYRAFSEQLDWNNLEGHRCPYDLTKPLPIVKVNEWYGYDHLEEIVVKRADQQIYTFKEGDFKRLRLNDIKDMLLLIVQNKLNNLDGNVVVHVAASLHMFA
ncbi:hypothetical protein Tco_1440260 [Tanacetum coccineum]